MQEKSHTFFIFYFFIIFEKNACIVVPFVLNFIRNKQKGCYTTNSNPIHYIMTNTGFEHASIRVTKKDFVVSIVCNHIRIQRSLPLTRATKEVALAEARELERIVHCAPKADKFKVAWYLMRHGGLAYYPNWKTDVSDKDEYIQWVAELTRERVLNLKRHY